MNWIGIGLALLAVVGLATAGRNYNVFQYMYFLRFQLLAALVACSPLVLIRDDAAYLLGNLFTLTPLQVVTTTLLVAFATWSLVFSGEVAWETAESEYGIPFRKAPSDGRLPLGRITYRPVALAVRHSLATALVLAVPLIWAILTFSSTDGWSWLAETRGETRMDVSPALLASFALSMGAMAGVLLRRVWYPLGRSPWIWGGIVRVGGIAVAFATLLLLYYYLVHPSRYLVNFGAASAGIFLAWLARKGLEWSFTGWLPKALRMVSYMLVALMFFMAVYEFLSPDKAIPVFRVLVPSISALGYLLLLGILILWVFAATARVLDRRRIPVLLVVVLTAVLLHQIFRADNLFSAHETAFIASPPLFPGEAYQAWSQSHPDLEYALPVLVAASGGGVGASYWAMYALTELQREMLGFGSSIVLISATSGGSLGTALYVDAFQNGNPPPEAVFPEIRSKSATPTLASVTWGLALPDFLRTISGGLFPADTLRNRGWALEQGWRRADVFGEGDATMDGWRQDVRAGARPTAIFNGVVAESGAKILMSPVDLDLDPVQACGHGPMGFRQLFSGLDLPVLTAVRLSASAPWVLPLSRPAGHPKTCHLGDGGYVDNTGVWSLVEFLRRVGPSAVENRAGLVVVELRGSRPRQREGSAGGGWWLGTVGPVSTLLNSTLTSQPARDTAELDLLVEQWSATGIPIHRFAFDMDAPAPAFWGLTDGGRDRIEEAWCSDENRRMLQALKTLWQDAHPTSPAPGPTPIGCA